MFHAQGANGLPRALSICIIAEAVMKCKEEFHRFFMKRYVFGAINKNHPDSLFKLMNLKKMGKTC